MTPEHYLQILEGAIVVLLGLVSKYAFSKIEKLDERVEKLEDDKLPSGEFNVFQEKISCKLDKLAALEVEIFKQFATKEELRHAVDRIQASMEAGFKRLEESIRGRNSN